MASGTEPGNATAGPHVCSHCRKFFVRLCDLNKHVKSHSRPFKCHVLSCKYHDQGWPTAKELERHNNDKHSQAPRTFTCLFPPCPYESKRESNCKQHMEKTHDWTYIRSKSNGKHSATPQETSPGYRLDTNISAAPYSAPTPPGPPFMPPPGPDFVLFPGDPGDDDDIDLGYEHPEGYNSQVYLPWTSPMTRLRRNESAIEEFTQTYNGAPERNTHHSDALIDPRLSQGIPDGLPDNPRFDKITSFFGNDPIKAESPNTSTEQLPSTKQERRPSSVLAGFSERLNISAVQPSGYHSPPHTSRPVARPSKASTLASQPSPLFKPTLTRRRKHEDDGQSPQKRLKSSSVENFSDTGMPDIFRYAHPHIYDIEKKDKYSPCHTPHKDISTLVPAHRLQVTTRIISSFEIDDDEYPHPHVGLCRFCWLTFHDRRAFEDHISRPCDKVSKGKREKWRILFDTFTPLVDPDSLEGLADGEHAMQSAGDQDGYMALEGDGGAWFDAATPPTSVPSPATFGLDKVAPPGGDLSKGFVPMNEHQRLQRDLGELHEKYHQLEQVTKVLVARQLYQAPHPSQASNSALFVATAPRSRLPNVGVSSGSNSLRDTASDQGSLVQHMDSQSTDVDVQGLMHDAQETLSRQNSGLSTTSRSTIHHVPTSPPPLPAEHARDDDGHCRGPPLETPSNRRPLPSIPDSGYDTDPRRCSLGDAGQVLPGAECFGNNPFCSENRIDSKSEQQEQHHIRLTAQEAGTKQVTENIPWGNPFATSSRLQPHNPHQQQPQQYPEFEDAPVEPYDPEFHLWTHEQEDFRSPNPLELDQFEFPE
ncbi:hypothetical protein B0T22DRAFT_503578 [Podospora appendiculata]|uniref:C2H2-type domain-containing protein n=1 Tax=Podospora appendiculata TaxID=314037 RepID=A0AAE1CFF0_9PEZI|nr:hypothetical protein B0T22DRAFT_503578 [Podospora appendiculata]